MRRPMARLAWAFNERVLEALAASGAEGAAQDWKCPPAGVEGWESSSIHTLAAKTHSAADADAALDAAEGGGEEKRAL